MATTTARTDWKGFHIFAAVQTAICLTAVTMADNAAGEALRGYIAAPLVRHGVLSDIAALQYVYGSTDMRGDPWFTIGTAFVLSAVCVALGAIGMRMVRTWIAAQRSDVRAFNASSRKVGGIRFLKLGRLCFAFCVTREYRPLKGAR